MLATGLVLVACGTADDAAPATEPPAVTAAPADDADLTANEASSTEGDTPDEAATEPAPVDASVDAAPAEAPAGEPAATEAPPATEAPAAAPVDAVLGGRAFASELAPASNFAENMLPDLLVDDIRSGQKVNIRNVFPAERPVLMWMWAPH